MPDEMMIVVAHGSRNPEWRTAVERQVRRAASEPGDHSIRLAFMELSPPSLMDVAREAVQNGITRIAVLPLFLADQGHVAKDVVPLVEEVRNAFDGLEVRTLPSMGQQPQFPAMLRSIADQELS